jgi:hypothetical protein
VVQAEIHRQCTRVAWRQLQLRFGAERVGRDRQIAEHRDAEAIERQKADDSRHADARPTTAGRTIGAGVLAQKRCQQQVAIEHRSPSVRGEAQHETSAGGEPDEARLARRPGRLQEVLEVVFQLPDVGDSPFLSGFAMPANIERTHVVACGSKAFGQHVQAVTARRRAVNQNDRSLGAGVSAGR